MSRDEDLMIERRRGYALGYNAGRSNKWPHADQIAKPPCEVVAKLMQAMKDMRDLVDGFQATIDPDDPWVELLLPIIDRADESLGEVDRWMLEQVRNAIPEVTR